MSTGVASRGRHSDKDDVTSVGGAISVRGTMASLGSEVSTGSVSDRRVCFKYRRLSRCTRTEGWLVWEHGGAGAASTSPYLSFIEP